MATKRVWVVRGSWRCGKLRVDHPLVMLSPADLKREVESCLRRREHRFGAWQDGEQLVAELAEIPFPSRNPRIGELLSLSLQGGVWRALKPRS